MSVVVVFKYFSEIHVIASTTAVSVAVVAMIGVAIVVHVAVAGVAVSAAVVVAVPVHVAVVAKVSAVAFVVVVAISTVAVGVVIIQLLEWLLHVPRQLLALLVHLLLYLKQPISNLLQHAVVVRRFISCIRCLSLLD